MLRGCRKAVNSLHHRSLCLCLHSGVLDNVVRVRFPAHHLPVLLIFRTHHRNPGAPHEKRFRLDRCQLWLAGGDGGGGGGGMADVTAAPLKHPLLTTLRGRFADDELRQGRSRRRFQTGLLIFLLLFFMDAKTPQESQGRSRRTAQVSSEYLECCCCVDVDLQQWYVRVLEVWVFHARLRGAIVYEHSSGGRDALALNQGTVKEESGRAGLLCEISVAPTAPAGGPMKYWTGLVRQAPGDAI